MGVGWDGGWRGDMGSGREYGVVSGVGVVVGDGSDKEE